MSLKRGTSERHARAMISIKDKETQNELVELIKEYDWNVRQLKDILNNY
ncbi:hypothetical protein ACOQFO_07970 [Ureibacillus sp. MALMAid1270]|nr:hypothetical protein [Ureibacillus acetophenoni]